MLQLVERASATASQESVPHTAVAVAVAHGAAALLAQADQVAVALGQAQRREQTEQHILAVVAVVVLLVVLQVVLVVLVSQLFVMRMFLPSQINLLPSQRLPGNHTHSA
jgi:uncharacterized membrane protein YdbT with pleckstrin-like domain